MFITMGVKVMKNHPVKVEAAEVSKPLYSISSTSLSLPEIDNPDNVTIQEALSLTTRWTSRRYVRIKPIEPIFKLSLKVEESLFNISSVIKRNVFPTTSFESDQQIDFSLIELRPSTEQLRSLASDMKSDSLWFSVTVNYRLKEHFGRFPSVPHNLSECGFIV
ncbi:hypothetical protein Hanom_Chr01g00053101 [Helianthus anomalus]